MHNNTKLLFEKYARGVFAPGMRVLEVGPDGARSTFRNIIGEDVRWTGIDIAARDGVDIVARSEYEFPLEDNSVDIVLSENVIEHVRMPWKWMRELCRVCKRGGCIITINPVSWGYHEYPVDCWRIYPEGMRALSEDCGLDVLESRFECLEVDPRHWRIPGHSTSGLAVGVSKLLHLPIQCAFDTITIARKG